MAKLTAKDRRELDPSQFALPPDEYPIPDKGHAKAALSEIVQHGSPKEISEVRRKVKEKFPSMQVKGVHKK